MAADMVWTIEWMQCKPAEGALQDVVITAGWRCTGTQGEYSGSVYSTCSFSQPSGEDFTPYGQLTQDQVLGWCWTGGVNKEAAEAAVQQQIADQINPPVVQPPLPWAQQ